MESKLKTKIQCSNIDIKTIYTFHEILGGGQFGTVRVGHKKVGSGYKKFAIKTITKKKMSAKDLQNLMNEVQILSTLDHPNIIKLEEAYQDQFYLHIVTELCEGHDLYTQCNMKDNLTDNNVCLLIFKLVCAVRYLHNNNIAHRDIKTDNIIFSKNDINSEPKLLDFGLSKKFSTDGKMKDKIGTPFYVCPDIIKGEYDETCDMWAIGVMAYLLISGTFPFYTETSKVPIKMRKANIEQNAEKELYNKILHEKPTFTDKEWISCSKKAIDFVKKCLEKNSKTRLTSAEAVKHPWFKKIVDELRTPQLIKISILQGILDFYNNNTQIERLVKRHMIYMLTQEQISELDLSFYAINTNLNGTINVDELIDAYKFLKIEADLDNINKAIKLAGGSICYTDFLASNVNLKKYNTKQTINEVFKYFDCDGNLFIDEKDLENYYFRKGKKALETATLTSYISEYCRFFDLKEKNKINIDGLTKLFINEDEG